MAVPRSHAHDMARDDRWAQLPPVTPRLVTRALRMSDLARLEADAVTAEILRRMEETGAFRLLLTLPGIGPLTAAGIGVTLGDPHRLRGSQPGTRHAGFDARIFPSGETNRTGHISHPGHRALRRCLIEAVLAIAIRGQDRWRPTAEPSVSASRLTKRG